VRELAYDLRPDDIADDGLASTLADRLRAGDDSLHVELDCRLGSAAIPADVQLAVIRIVQEAVTNVRRHAAARTCGVTLVREGERLAITVIDDGRGPGPSAGRGIGLASIEARARQFGGDAEFGPASVGSALRASLTIPGAGRA
jgi:signal transduction histidine kinase